jgi:predicted amidohydrolase YtcJ
MNRLDWLVVLLLPGAALAIDCGSADLIITNAHIITMDDARRVVDAAAIRDGKFVAVGDAQEVVACAGKETRTLDLNGRTVLPGFIDVHTHAHEWSNGIVRGDVDASAAKVHSIAEIIAAVAQQAKAREPGQWVLGFGWDDEKLAEHRYITRQDLDKAAPDVPVCLTHVTGHLDVANSAALKLAGITRDTPDPPGGIIEHDANGEPTGVVKDTAMRVVESHEPSDPPDLSARAARYASEQAAAVGLTTIHDIWGGSVPFGETMRGYQEAYHRGWLKIRVQMAPGVANVADAERLAESGLYTGFGDDRLKLGAVKMFADGGMGARTIAIYPPGLMENGHENLGLLLWTPQDVQKAQLILARAGWQLSTHAIGDRAMDEVLDSYAYVTKQLGLKEPRFRIIHGGLSTPAILKRLREQHVLVDSNPGFVYWISSFFDKYGPERIRWAYPGKSYFDNGIIAAATTDVFVTPISPWPGLYAAVERRAIGTGKLYAPEERLPVLKALEMFTRNPAYIGFEEKKKGSIEAGKLADFIVIDRDVLSVPSSELKDVKVLSTWVGGERIYEAQ